MFGKFSKVLTGFLSIALSGALCLIPSFESHAAISGSDTLSTMPIYDEYDDGSIPITQTTQVGLLQADLELNYNSLDCDYVTAWGGQIRNCLDGTSVFAIYIICPNLGDNYDVTASYDFTYLGNSYSGNAALSAIDYACAHYTFELLPPAKEDTAKTAEDQMYAEINEDINEIGLAVKGVSADGSVNEEKVVELEQPGALNGRVLQAMTTAEGVTCYDTFTYMGIIFRSTITPEAARTAYSSDITWYGPCYMAEHFPTVIVGVVQ